MRKIFSILLLVLFGLSAVAPLFAESAEASVPACCRGNGAHRCMRGMQGMQGMNTEQGPAESARLAVLRAKCPCCLASPVSIHGGGLSLHSAQTLHVPVACREAGAAQTASRLRIALDRSRGKRGPPAALLS